VVERLVDPDPVIRNGAAVSLGYVGSEKSFDSLAACIRDDSERIVRLNAARALTALGRTEGLSYIMQELATADAALAREIVEGPSFMQGIRFSNAPKLGAEKVQEWLSWWAANKDKLKWDGKGSWSRRGSRRPQSAPAGMPRTLKICQVEDRGSPAPLILHWIDIRAPLASPLSSKPRRQEPPSPAADSYSISFL